MLVLALERYTAGFYMVAKGNILTPKILHHHLSRIFRDKIDDCSLVFMPMPRTIVVEKIKCVGNHAYIFGRKR